MSILAPDSNSESDFSSGNGASPVSGINSPSAVTIEVYSEDGIRRAIGRADSFERAVDWLDTVPLCRAQEAKLMVRVEDRSHSGCWLYIAPLGTPENWILSARPKRVRAQIERRRSGVTS